MILLESEPIIKNARSVRTKVRKNNAGVTYGETISAAAAKSLPLLAAN